MSRVVVIGAGVVGLSTAARLLGAGHQVRVVAEKFTPSTTSDVAAAMWWPFHAQPADRVLAWCMASFDEFVRLAEDPSSGVVMRRGLFAFGGSVPDWALRLPGARRIEQAQLPENCESAASAVAPLIEMNRYMPWLQSLVQDMGALFEQEHATAIADYADQADVVVNCTGLGARALVSDALVVPVRGRTLRLAQVGIDEFFGSEAGEWPLHIFPRENDIVVGGTYEPEVESDQLDPTLDRSILARVVEVEPRLADATVIEGVTGFRPSRSEVRLESQYIENVRVVHNYGHGGGGVTLSWGCADDVLRIGGEL